MDRLVKKLEEVNSTNKQNLKKLHSKVQTEIQSGKLLYLENYTDAVISKSKKASQ